MKYFEYDLNDIKTNIKRNKRHMIIILSFFVLVGGAAGYIQGVKYKQSYNDYDNSIIADINIEDIPRDEEYYYSVFCNIKKTHSSLNAYCTYLNQIDLNGESRELLNNFENNLSYFNDIYDNFQNYYYSNTPIICEDEEAAKNFVESNISFINEKLKDADIIIEELNSNLFSKAFSDTTESGILDSNQNLIKSLDIWERQLEFVENEDASNILDVNMKMDELIENNIVEQNQVISEFNNMINEMETNEQYDIIYNPYLLDNYLEDGGIDDELSQDEILNNRKNQALIYARSISGIDNTHERFYSILTFFTLFGIILSLLYGLFKRSR